MNIRQESQLLLERDLSQYSPNTHLEFHSIWSSKSPWTSVILLHLFLFIGSNVLMVINVFLLKCLVYPHFYFFGKCHVGLHHVWVISFVLLCLLVILHFASMVIVMRIVVQLCTGNFISKREAVLSFVWVLNILPTVTKSVYYSNNKKAQ